MGKPNPGMEFSPPPSNVDWQKLEKEFEREYRAALELFRDEIRSTYQEKAQTQLNTTRDRYLEGLSFTIEDDGVSVDVNGWLPQAVESGWSRFDMKPGLLAGRQNRIIRLRNGKFRSVSKNSPPGSWWHPGHRARPISEEVKAEEDKIAEKAIEPFVNRFLSRIEI